MIRQMVKIFLFFMSTIVVVVFNQNCGQVHISQPETVLASAQSSTHILAQACVNSIKMLPEKTKFVFVIDLSRSNIGEFYKANYLFNGMSYPGYWFFNPKQGTDPDGVRFDSISQFVSTCGKSVNADYSVIGFSNSAGSIAKNGLYNTLECKNQFMDSNSVLAQLNAMKQAQLDEARFNAKFKEPSVPFLGKDATEAIPLIFKETDYVAATNCISSTIEEDLSKVDNTTSNYQVFFISDGEAQSKASGCEDASVTDKVGCYTEKMNVKLSYLMKLSSAKSKPIRIQSMYYTVNGAQNLKIESYLKYLSAIGQTNNPINLGSLQNTSQDENPFCKLLAVDKSIIYRSNKIFSINMNAIKVGDQIKKDSDSDGIPDEDEQKFGSNPNNSRSIVPGVLDGVCKIIGSKDLCIQARSQIVCDENKINQFNISDCDIKILKLDKLSSLPQLAGIDSANDGIPDYVKILKGLNPLTNTSYLDFDGDGMTNMQEVSLGLDPFTPDANSTPLITSESIFEDQLEGCSSGGWKINITSLGGVEGKNNLLFYFKTESKNTQGLQEYRISKAEFDLQKDDHQNWFIKLYKTIISPIDFYLVKAEVSP